MAVKTNSLLLVCAYLSAALIGHVLCLEGACLQNGKHKTSPGPEPHLKECKLYAENTCCSDEDIQDLSSPASSFKNTNWDRCGSLSPACESFLKRVVCFYRCSPDAARWPHPHQKAYIQAVPLCHSFCRDWYDACRLDMTCARNWARDPRGQNCTGGCVQYQQMYQHGRDLCESLWGDAFMTVEDDVEEGGEGAGGRPCGCLSLSPSDREVMAALRAQEEDPEELDTTKSGLSQYRAPCHAKLPRAATLPPQARRSKGNLVMRKRSVVVEDVEGSGSGL
ncbi:retbindin [Aplochiton taeniatus]